MQKYPLHVKLGRTQARIMEYYRELNGKVYVSFSGGKDSTVLLHITRQLFPDVPAVFCDTKLEFPEIRQFVDEVENVITIKPQVSFNEVISSYGYPVISKEVARTVYYARKGSEWALQRLDGKFKNGTECRNYKRFIRYKNLVHAPFITSDICCDKLKKAPMKNYEKESGRFPIVGTLAEESFRRQSTWMKQGCNVFNAKRTISNPMSIWTNQDVLMYLKLSGIPYASLYGEINIDSNNPHQLDTTGFKRTGCYGCMFGVHSERKPNRFQQMAVTHPKLYDYCINKLGYSEILTYLNVDYKPIQTTFTTEDAIKLEVT